MTLRACDTLYNALRENLGSVFENKTLRGIFGSKRSEEISGDNVVRSSRFVLVTKYCWFDQIKENEMGGAYGTGGQKGKVSPFRSMKTYTESRGTAPPILKFGTI